MTLKAYLATYEDGRLVWDSEDRPATRRARVIVTVVEDLEAGDDEREAWHALSAARLDSAFGDDEPEYSLDDIRAR